MVVATFCLSVALWWPNPNCYASRDIGCGMSAERTLHWHACLRLTQAIIRSLTAANSSVAALQWQHHQVNGIQHSFHGLLPHRQHLGEAATALGPSLRPAAGGGSSTGIAPIKAALQRLIRRGIAVNEATQTPPEQVGDFIPGCVSCHLLFPAAVHAVRSGSLGSLT